MFLSSFLNLLGTNGFYRRLEQEFAQVKFTGQVGGGGTSDAILLDG
jgi:hypothetical protein